MPNLTNNQYDYMYPTSSPKPRCQSVTFLAWKKGLITIENGGQVATWSRLQHNRTTNLGGRIIIWISTKSTYPIIHREIITFFNYFTNDSIFSGINSKTSSKFTLRKQFCSWLAL